MTDDTQTTALLISEQNRENNKKINGSRSFSPRTEEVDVIKSVYKVFD